MFQEYSSRDTSRNQVPALFKKIVWKRGSVNFDIGGGKYDGGSTYLKDTHNVYSFVYDIYNRDCTFNKMSLEFLGRFDTVTCANVLNVIKEKEVRSQVILQASNALKDGGMAYFSIYARNGSGIPCPTVCGWQNNMTLKAYLPEIYEHFECATIFRNYIVAWKPRRKAKAKYYFDCSSAEFIEY